MSDRHEEMSQNDTKGWGWRDRLKNTTRDTVLKVITSLVVLSLLIQAGSFAWLAIERQQRIDSTNEFRDEVCVALPNVAANTAEALVNILVADARQRGVPEAEVQETIRLGALYEAEARSLTQGDLTTCSQYAEAAKGG